MAVNVNSTAAQWLAEAKDLYMKSTGNQTITETQIILAQANVAANIASTMLQTAGLSVRLL